MFHAVHCNPIITIRANQCAQFYSSHNIVTHRPLHNWGLTGPTHVTADVLQYCDLNKIVCTVWFEL